MTLSRSALRRFLMVGAGVVGVLIGGCDLVEDVTGVGGSRCSTAKGSNQTVIVGAGGTLLVDDGGQWGVRTGSWGRSGLFDVEFQSAQVGVAVGGTGVAAVTTDGGASWTGAELASNDLFGVSAPDGCTSVVTSNEASGYRTDDDGATWETVEFGVSDDGTDYEWTGLALSFFDGDSGIGVGSFPGLFGFSNGGVLTTADGGRTWAESFSVNSALYGAYAAGERAVVVGVDGVIAYTSDRGATWETAGDLYGTGFDSNLYGVYVDETGRGIAVGEGGTILLTPNGGVTWRQTASGTESDLWEVDCGRGVCVAVGDDGTALRSVDAGTSWERLDVGTDEHLYGVYVGREG